jgi:flagellar assembly protein FliH
MSNPTDVAAATEEGKNPFADSIQEKVQGSFEAGRAQGLQEGRQLERAEQGVRLREIEKERIESTARVSEQFARERDSFLRSVEPEVVKLALSIASRILRHEAQMDPLLLAGAVRVALGQVAEKMPVRLRVPAGDFKLWSETFAQLPNLRVKPTIIADEAILLGDCVVETDMGSVDLGLGNQLKEIGRAFFDGASSRAAQESSALRSGSLEKSQ